MKNFIIYLSLTALLCVFCGCNKRPHPKPPTEKLALTVRFFESIDAKDTETAVRQGQKLYDMDDSQEYILRLVGIQQSNGAIGSADKLIRKGKIDEAVRVIENAKTQYPDNQTLDAALIQVKELRGVEKVFISMKKARNSSAMRGARIAAKARLSRNLTPTLEKYFENYEKQEKNMERVELRKVSEAEKQALSDASKAAAADRMREKSNLRHQQQISRKMSEGETLRQQAGDIPFTDPPEPEEE